MFARMTMAAAALALAAFVAGCESNGKNGASESNRGAVSAAPATQAAATCGKCQVTWAKVPYSEKGRVISYSTRKTMDCPDCRSAVDNLFATGNFEHACKTCGNATEICEAH